MCHVWFSCGYTWLSTTFFNFLSNILKPNPSFLKNEKLYEESKKTILAEESKDEKGFNATSNDEEDNEFDDDDDDEQMKIKDETKTYLVNLQTTIVQRWFWGSKSQASKN